ncbi:efflux RND transporter periplasmic adaptor subunit [Flavobacterium sp. F-65]|uniref:Efflux RND transporter periplasmic adaptor subunit n=1 Tax=Flavobacterium pisciphilum TaxID=2893755 RepID=A0ABS8MNQ6_9FLAO|nr:HlyD family efflux transporter periplasmic adaptor subunit [Flavobacterium sp. F-65]MCC9070396.1 efflux RND transporter periplasmic adaptor subunit [Flavobacterium sp. F-65]
MKKVIFIITAAVVISCSGNKNEFDATGTFEAVETIIPAEASGIIKELKVEEGNTLKEGQVVGYIDTIQLSLKREQLLAQIKATQSKKPDINSQLDVYREQLKQANIDEQRMRNLVKADAATRKQLDDAVTKVAVLQKQINALQKQLDINTTGIDDETQTLKVQVSQINDQLLKSKIVNKITGTVLTKYAEMGEMATVGKPLYKIADLSTIVLRVYITGDQLPNVKLNDKVKVFVDATDKTYKEHEGVIEWISDKAEFTPKTIQTKDERANLVYAVKVRVKNDGYLKIGMYGEIKF